MKPSWCTIFLSMFISFLYMFQATTCPSSGETTVFMRHLVLVILCGWLFGMLEHMLLHTRQSSIWSDKYQVLYKYNCFSWWWAHSCLKHVQKRNKNTKKNCEPSWLYLQDYRGMHGQENIKRMKERSEKLCEVKNQRLKLNRNSRHPSISKCGWDKKFPEILGKVHNLCFISRL